MPAYDAFERPSFAPALTLPDWPMFGLADDMRPAMRAMVSAATPSALATLHTVHGSGPRPPGAQMLLSAGHAAGFLSGGCIESDVAIHAAATIADGAPRQLVYGEGGPWPDIRLLCGARIEILVERLLPGDHAIAALLKAADARQPAIWITDGRTRRVEAAPHEAGAVPACEMQASPFQLRRLYQPAPRLVVVGADPTALAIASLGAQSGFETTLVRPKGPIASPPLAGVSYSRADAGEALAEIRPDRWTAVAIATHDWEIDHDALLAALPSEAGYVGVLGARRRLPERLSRLRAAGLDEAVTERLHGPIGLDLGGKSPWEVAVSVIAQIVGERSAEGQM